MDLSAVLYISIDGGEELLESHLLFDSIFFQETLQVFLQEFVFALQLEKLGFVVFFLAVLVPVEVFEERPSLLVFDIPLAGEDVPRNSVVGLAFIVRLADADFSFEALQNDQIVPHLGNPVQKMLYERIHFIHFVLQILQPAQTRSGFQSFEVRHWNRERYESLMRGSRVIVVVLQGNVGLDRYH